MAVLTVAQIAFQVPSSYVPAVAQFAPTQAAAHDGNVVTWTSRTNLPSPRFGAAAVHAGGYVYVIGGASFTSDGTSGAVGDSVNTVFRAKINDNGSLGAFSAVASLNSPRMYAAAFARDRVIYVFGGYSGGNSKKDWAALNTVERASVNADGSLTGWTVLATTLTSARAGMGTFSPEATTARLYLAGGETGFGTTSHTAHATVESIAFNELDGGSAATWRAEASLPSARRGHGTTGVRTKVLVGGGQDASGGVTRTIFRGDIALFTGDPATEGTITWSTLPTQMPVLSGISYHAQAAANGFLYVAGGIGNQTDVLSWIGVNTDQTLAGTWANNAGGPQFSTTTSSPMVAVDGFLYYFAHNFERSDTVEITLHQESPASTTGWTASRQGLTPRFIHETASARDRLYILGGANHRIWGAATSSVDTVYPSGGPTAGGSPMLRARLNFAAIGTQNALFAIGGRDETNALLSSVEWTPVNADGSFAGWAETTPLPEGRQGHGTAVIGDELYVFGGQTAGSVALDSVIKSTIGTTGLGPWTSAGTLPIALFNAPIAQAGGFTYSVSGTFPTTPGNAATQNDVRRWDGGNSWTAVQPLPFGADQAIGFGSVLVAVGPFTSRSAHYATVFNDGTISAWTELPDTVFDRSFSAVGYLNDVLYITGGLGEVNRTGLQHAMSSLESLAAPAPSGISGIATCNGETPLLGATVELYSGSVLVATTTSSLDTGVYVFSGVAPDSTYTIRISKHYVSEIDSYTISCAVTVTTDASGNATAGPGVLIPNRKNHTWNTAFEIAAGVPITDYIFRSGQSTWFKIPVRQGQRVTVRVSDVPANYSLALYKDIRKLYDAQIAALADDPLEAILNLDASVAPDALSPDALSPDELSPDELSPDELSPDELSPDELSPDELSPDELSPDELSPDALSPDALSPDELSPDELSPDELSPDAYAAAQTAALIGVSANVGLSPEQITRNTWENTGFFYMRVRGHNGAFDASRPFTIRATITDVSCLGASLTEHPVTLTAPATGRQTLILTNTARLSGDTTAFTAKLDSLALHAGVVGAVVDLATLPAATSAYVQWDGAQDCPAAANIVARSVKDVINAYRTANPGLTYIVVAGDDSVVPFYRQPDQSGLGNERDYRPAVKDPTASQASLRLGYVLTQDYYGSIRPVSRFDHELYLPDMAVGRLVESISEMTTVIDAYLGVGGVVAPTRALVSGYDFLSDAAGFIADQFAANGLTTDRDLIQPVGESPSGPNAWTADQLRAKLFGTTSYGILSLNAHFSANRMLAADYATRIASTEVSGLPAADLRFLNALILSTGCHSAYGIVDAHATDLTDPMDWAQAFAGRGATLIGGTGYQYGDTDFMKYSEKILADTALELRYGTGPVPIGVALANAKRTYLSSLATLRGIDEKALAEATLYGLPMLGYDLPAAGRIARPTTGTAGTLTTLTSDGLSFANVTPTYTLTRNSRTLTIDGGSPTQAIYYDIDGNVAVSPAAPVLPQLTLGVGAAGHNVRGAVLESAVYADEAGITPFTDVATTEVRGAHPRYVTDVFTPVRPFDLNHFAGSNFISTPFQFRSTAGGTTGVARRLTSESFRLYYSNLTDVRALAAAPVVYTVTLRPNATDSALVDVEVLVGALATVGVEEVFVTFTGEAGSLYGQWMSLRLASAGETTHGAGLARQYTGSIPRGTTAVEDVRALVQAVGGNGLVTWASNNGAYYSVVIETATAAQPKATTSLSLEVPASGTYLSTVTVRAQLLEGTSPLGAQPVAFRSGGVRVNATTGSDGWASAQLRLVTAPGTATVKVGFAEDLTHLGSGADAQITIARAPSSFVGFDNAPIPVGGSLLLATLNGAGAPLGGQLVRLEGGGVTRETFTDGYGRVRLDTADGFPSGAYSVLVTYGGNDRYEAAAPFSSLVVVYDPSTFVTGGGWFLTPSDSIGLVVGKKANFGLNMKYKDGTTVPTGSLQFLARESNVSFTGTSIDWLAINVGSAEAQGSGTLNGAAGWRFRVTLGEGPDRFHIRIWQDGVSTYDAPTYSAGNTLGGGSVVIH